MASLPIGAGPPSRMAAALASVLLVTACGGSPAGESAAPTTTAPTTTAPTTSATTTPTTTLPPSSTAAPTTTSFPAETTSSTTEGTTMRLTLVYDNTAYDDRLGAAWGFAALVEISGQRILFDTGGDGTLLLANLATLDIDPLTLDAVVLSHEHEDHTGGLAALLAAGAAPTVYLPASFPTAFKEAVSARTEVVQVTGPQEIMPGVFSTGELGRSIIEQALVVRTRAGAVVLTGCAHPGIVEIVRRAREVLPDPVALVVGGFHLGQATPAQIEDIIAAFRTLGVQQVAPAHCTGEAATEAFAREYGDDCLAAGAGRVIEIG